jgi:acyl-CoA thioesterase-1
VLVAHRGTSLVVGTIMAVLATLFTLLASGSATGADAERCARFSTQSQIRERLVTGNGDRIVVIGDSYSVGLGLRDPATSWPSSLPGRTHVFGFSGSGFSEHASPCGPASYADRAPHALRHSADLVVVEGGLNDHDQPASAIRAGFRSLIPYLRGHKVLVVGPPAAPARSDGARRVDAILREECTRAGLDFLSMLGEQLPYLADGLHLTPAGHRAFGRAVARTVAG